MDNSIAVWADSAPGESHLHINYWIIDKKNNQSIYKYDYKYDKHRIVEKVVNFLRPKKREHFVDIGLKLRSWGGGKIFCYVPIALSSEDLSCVGRELKETLLARALFNEDCRVKEVEDDYCIIDLKDEELKVVFLDEIKGIDMAQAPNGTTIELNIPKEEPYTQRSWYVRFRVKFHDLGAKQTIQNIFSENYSPTGSFYQSVMNSIDAIDFRVADKKSLNKELFRDFGKKFLEFKKLHFFAIHDQKEELHFCADKPTKMRILEGKAWDKYLRSITKDDRKYTTAHWTKDNVTSWDTFFKVRFCSSNGWTIFSYFSIAFVFGVVINSTAPTITKFVLNIPAYMQIILNIFNTN